jgi:tetratricopeptide (TPR) repeat protein
MLQPDTRFTFSSRKRSTVGSQVKAQGVPLPGRLMNKHKLPKLALLILLSLNCCAPVFASALLEEGKQAFQEKRFNAAAKTLNEVITQEAANPEGYYWLGRSLEELKDRDGARTMYMAAFKLNPFGPQAPTAKKALMDLAARQAQLDHPNDGPELTARTLQLIERQAGDMKRMKIGEANMRAQWKINQGNQQAYALGYQQPTTIQNVPGGYTPGFYAPQQSITAIRNQVQTNGTGVNPYLNVGSPYANRTYNNWAGYPGANGTGYGGVPAAAGYNPYANTNMYGYRNVSNTAVINSSWIRADSQVQAMRAQTAGVASATELQKSANNLESLLGEKPMAGSPHLRALGPNLFVRNYADHDDDSIPPVDPIIELKAKQQRLADLERGDRAKAQRLFP